MPRTRPTAGAARADRSPFASLEKSTPVFFMSAAMCVDLPPGAAHMSMTRSFSRGCTCRAEWQNMREWVLAHALLVRQWLWSRWAKARHGEGCCLQRDDGQEGRRRLQHVVPRHVLGRRADGHL